MSRESGGKRRTGVGVGRRSKVGVDGTTRVPASAPIGAGSPATEATDRIDVTDQFTLLNNQWGNAAAEQHIWENDDGRYGWDFDATETTDGINYPEVFVGTRPWGSDTGVQEYPIRRSDVDELVFDVEATYDISGGEWDLAEEWWLMEEKPGVETQTHQYEVMLLLDWGGGHDHGSPVATDLWTDEFGNTVDLWARYDSGGTSATFYVFRVQEGHDGGQIDAKRVVDWLTTEEDVPADLWISGAELGTEYWPGAAGSATIEQFDVVINGTTYESGLGGPSVSARGQTVSRGGEATVTVDATAVESVTVDDLWTDWTVTDATGDGGTVTEAVETAGEYRLVWDSPQASVTPSLTVAPPAETYVGGAYRLTVTAAGDGESVETTATVEIE